MENLSLVLLVACQPIAIWFSVRAKPIGDKSYRWATYVACMSGLLGFVFGLIGLLYGIASLFDSIGRANRYGVVAVGALGISAILCCVGLIRRKKYGAVFFFITFIAPTMIDSSSRANKPSVHNLQHLGEELIVIALTGVYLIRRWPLLEGATPAVKLTLS